MHKNKGSIRVAINGSNPDPDGTKFNEAIQEYHFYSAFEFTAGAVYRYSSSTRYELGSVENVYVSYKNDYTNYLIRNRKSDGSSDTYKSYETRNAAEVPAEITMAWSEIYAPGAAYNGISFENGFVLASLGYKYAPHSNGSTYYRNVDFGNAVYYIPFASKAEYNAAVGLTYEPLTLTEVRDDPTVV